MIASPTACCSLEFDGRGPFCAHAVLVPRCMHETRQCCLGRCNLAIVCTCGLQGLEINMGIYKAQQIGAKVVHMDMTSSIASRLTHM